MAKLRKIFTISVMFVTILSMSVVVAPNVDAAASAGDIIKMDGLSSVYYLGADGKRYVFPNEQTYFSWYSDFSGVVTIPQSELESYPLGANVTMRAGTKLVKITTNPKVYAVEADGSLVAIPDEATAIALYGDNWAARVVDVPDAFFTNYTISTGEVSATTYPGGSLIKTADSADIFYVNADGSVSKIADEAAMLSNRFQNADVITVATGFTMPSAGDDISSADSTLVDTSQGGGSGTGITPGAGTGLTVAIASDTSASASLPLGASGVSYTKVNFTAANDGDVTIKNLVVTRIGIGAASDFAGVWIYDADGNRLTSSRTVSASSNTATFSGVNYVVAAGTTKALIVKATGSSSGTSGNNGFAINAASDITTNGASVSGSFPVSGNLMSMTSVVAGSLTYTLQSVEDGSLQVGEMQREVADIKIAETSTGSKEDITLYSIAFTNDGAADSNDLVNFKLYQSSTLVAEVATITSDRVLMTLTTPLVIKKGSSKNFSLKADIKGGVSTTGIQYDIDDLTDIIAVGNNYGFAVAVAKASSGSAVRDIAITAGEFTIEIDGPAAYDVVADADDVVLANMTFTTGGDEDVEIKNFYGYIDCTDVNTAAVLETGMDNIQLVNVDSGDYYDVSDDDNIVDDDWVFKVTNFSIPAGASNWRIEMDLSDTYFGNGDSCVFKMDASADNSTTPPTGSVSGTDGVEAENQAGKALNDIKPGAAIQGNTVTVQTASLAIANVTLSAGDAVSKTKDVELIRFSAEAGSAEAVKMTQVILEATSTTQYLADASNYTLLASDGTVLQEGVSSVNTTNDTVTFSSMTNGGVTIPAGETQTFYVTADINATVTGSQITVRMKDAGVTAEDSDGDDLAAASVSGDVVTVIGRNVTLRSKGIITFTTDSDSPSKKHILKSSDENLSILKFKADASYEDITLKDLRFSISGTGDNATSSIASLELWQDGTLIKEVSTSNASYGWVFSNLESIGDNGVTVAKDTDSIFELKMNVAGIGDGAQDTASSGADITVTLLTADTGVQARGFSSNTDLVTADITVTSVASQQNYVYATVVNAVDPGSQATTLSSGEEEALRFKLTPSTNEAKTATLKSVTVNYSRSGAVTVYGFKLYNGSGTEVASSTTGATMAAASGSVTLAFDNAGTPVALSDDIAGAGETYIVKVFTTLADADDKFNVDISINGNGGSGDGITWNDGADTTGNVSWIDLAEGSTTTEIRNQLVF